MALASMARDVAIPWLYEQHLSRHYRVSIPYGIYRTVFDVSLNAKKLFFEKNTYPTLHFDMKFKDYKQLKQEVEYFRKQGMRAKTLFPNSYPVSVRYADKVIPVKVKLKGIYLDHVSFNKWSLSVKVKDGKNLFGMREFSLQSPRVRDNNAPFVFKKSLNLLGIDLLMPKFELVNVVLNGDNLKLMMMEERFNKELAESNQRVYGGFFKFTTKLFPASTIKDMSIVHYKLPIGLLNINSEHEHPIAYVYRMWQNFIEGKIKASELFDAKLTGGYLAILDYWGLHHPLLTNNIRYYFNPINMKLEPVVYDLGFNEDYKYIGELVTQRYPISLELLRDNEIMHHYIKTADALIKMTEHEDFIGVLRRFDNKLAEEIKSAIISIEMTSLENNHKLLLEKIKLPPKINETRHAVVVKHVYANNYGYYDWMYYTPVISYLNVDDNESSLSLLSTNQEDVYIDNIYYVGLSGQYHEMNFLRPPVYPIIMEGVENPLNPPQKKIILKSINLSNIKNIIIKVRRKHEGRKHTINPTLKLSGTQGSLVPQGNIEETLINHPYILLDDNDDKTLVIRQGKWDVNRDIIVPDTYKLRLEPGVELSFAKNSALISYGALEFNGEQAMPIILKGKGRLHENSLWNGVVVMNAPYSSIKHVKIYNTAGINRGSWSLRGGIMFYQSPVEIEYTSFINNKAEDALNLVKSSFKLDNIMIQNAKSDGLDIDFSKGEVTNSSFKQIGLVSGGDAIDTSGSTVIMKNIKIDYARDKGISVGENSYVDVYDLQVSNTQVGAASKDGSTLNISVSTFKKISSYALMAYVKKNEYGPAELIADKASLINVHQNAIAQLGNRILIEGVEVAPVQLDVKQLYQTIMRSEKSR